MKVWGLRFGFRGTFGRGCEGSGNASGPLLFRKPIPYPSYEPLMKTGFPVFFIVIWAVQFVELRVWLVVVYGFRVASLRF